MVGQNKENNWDRSECGVPRKLSVCHIWHPCYKFVSPTAVHGFFIKLRYADFLYCYTTLVKFLKKVINFREYTKLKPRIFAFRQHCWQNYLNNPTVNQSSKIKFWWLKMWFMGHWNCQKPLVVRQRHRLETPVLRFQSIHTAITFLQQISPLSLIEN